MTLSGNGPSRTTRRLVFISHANPISRVSVKLFVRATLYLTVIEWCIFLWRRNQSHCPTIAGALQTIDEEKKVYFSCVPCFRSANSSSSHDSSVPGEHFCIQYALQGTKERSRRIPKILALPQSIFSEDFDCQGKTERFVSESHLIYANICNERDAIKSEQTEQQQLASWKPAFQISKVALLPCRPNRRNLTFVFVRASHKGPIV